MTTSKKRPPRLGRGLSSLMSSPVKVIPPQVESATNTEGEKVVEAGAETLEQAPSVTLSSSEPNTGSPPPAGVDDGNELHHLPIDSLQPNRHQPRQRFDASGLERLAASIKAEGVMQPIVVRRIWSGKGEGYEIVAGERRWRAAQQAGLTAIPSIVRELNDRQLAEWALIENLQREDLNPIERAEAFSRLIDQFGLSHEEAGTRIGMDRSSISNHLRLLSLGEPVQQLIREGLLSMGQARAMAGLSDVDQQRMLAERAVRQGMSVREVEAAVRRLASGGPQPGKASSPGRSAYLTDLEKQISQQLGTKAKIRPGRKKGTGALSLDFYSLDQFDALVGKLGVEIQ